LATPTAQTFNGLISIRIKNDHRVASPYRAAALSAAQRCTQTGRILTFQAAWLLQELSQHE